MWDELVSMTGLEKILNLIDYIIGESLNQHKREYDADPYDVENLLECRKLCDKLLHYDYFNKSESYLHSAHIEFDGKNSKILMPLSIKKLDIWERLYKKDLKNKKKDLRKLFNLIVESSEEI